MPCRDTTDSSSPGTNPERGSASALSPLINAAGVAPPFNPARPARPIPDIPTLAEPVATRQAVVCRRSTLIPRSGPPPRCAISTPGCAIVRDLDVAVWRPVAGLPDRPGIAGWHSATRSRGSIAASSPLRDCRAGRPSSRGHRNEVVGFCGRCRRPPSPLARRSAGTRPAGRSRGHDRAGGVSTPRRDRGRASGTPWPVTARRSA